MKITTDIIKALREKTGVSVMQCKKALEEAGGDSKEAEIILKKHSVAVAKKKSERTLSSGIVGSYVHDGDIGAMVILSCETDFVAKHPEFGALARALSMQIAAMDPKNEEDLLEQPSIKDESRTVHDLLNEATQKFGERIEISRFAPRRRERLDQAVEHFALVLAQVDFNAFLRDEMRRIAGRVSHDIAHLSLQAVRTAERLLTRLVRYLRSRHAVDTPPGENVREFVKTLSDFKGKLKATHPEVTDIQ